MKRKKIIIIITVIVALLAVALLIAVLSVNAMIVSSVKDKIVEAEDVAGAIDADCILILGAGVRADGSPSDMLRDRLAVGVEVYEVGGADKLLVSGDHSRKDYDEVGAMEQYCIEAGIPDDAIYPDYAGFSTYESLYRARDIFCAEKIVIVTQEYHLYRALYVAEKLGLEAVGVSADLNVYAGQNYRDLREVLARNKDFIYTIFMPKPTYLGEQIPIK